MRSLNGTFIWYDLMTTDVPAAARFYGDVVGWSANDSGMPGQSYMLLSAGPARVGGMMAIPPEVAARGTGPGWTGYVAVDDVDEYARRVKEKGGKVHRAPEDIPTVGRFAVVADPQGAVFILFKGMGEAPPAMPPDAPGTIGWHELYASEWESAFAFYADLFGWTKADAVDMGPMGLYQMFKTGGDYPVGGMMTKPASFPLSFWGYYFNVANIQAAIDRVNSNGGTVLNGPQEVPGGMRIAQCRDPQGAHFNLVAPA